MLHVHGALWQVETDKATVDFEAQEEGFVAKVLVEAGSNVLLGTPIAITVSPGDADMAVLATAGTHVHIQTRMLVLQWMCG